jgi:protein TonB
MLLSIATHVAVGAAIRTYAVQRTPLTKPSEISRDIAIDATPVPPSTSTSSQRGAPLEKITRAEKQVSRAVPKRAATQNIADAPGEARGVDGGGASGVELAAAPGDATAAAQPINVTLPFGEGMTPPTLVGGALRPSYTREALEAKVEGRVVARCTLTADGRLTDCRILKGLPFLDRAVLSTLAEQRYAPVRYQGHAQSVFYTLTFRFELP